MRRLVLTMGMVWGMCTALVMCACMVGGRLTSHQLGFTVRYREFGHPGVVVADVERGLNINLNQRFPDTYLPSREGLIAFMQQGDTVVASDLYQMAHAVVIPDHTEISGWLDAVWSADGTRLALVAAENNDSYHLDERIYISDGITLRNLMAERSFRAISDLAWSADGTRLAFSVAEDNISAPGIYVLDIDSGAFQRVTADNLWAVQPVWSPDGTQLVFNGRRDNQFSELFLMNADGGELRNLTQSPASDVLPAWSPDGRHIAYMSGEAGNSDIYVIDLPEQQVRRVSYHQAYVSSPVWSGDSTRIAFQSGPTLFEAQIYVVGADGTGERRLSFTGVASAYPVWLP
ncbi:MAG: hypothetical protein U0694_21490 [Anaerolineae bacterium]